MPNYQFSTTISQSEYESFINNHPLCNLLQSYQWAKIKNNWDHLYTGVYNQDHTLVATGLVLIKKLPLSFTMFYIPRGPIMDYKNKELLSFYFNQLKKVAKKYHCLFIKCDPGIHVKDYKIGETQEEMYPETQAILENMKAAGAIHQGFTTYIEESVQPRYQANVYKTETFEEDLPRHTRRLIKDALKRNVQVVKADMSRLQEFSDVVSLTEERKHVSLRNKEYFEKLMNAYQDDAYLFLAQVNISENLEKLRQAKLANDQELEKLGDGAPKKLRRLQDIDRSLQKDIKEFETFVDQYPDTTVIAGILSIKCKDTMEMLYAGMNDKFKKFMPQYYLYTENMKYAFEHGCNYANMGGVEGDLKDGLTKFKSNFSPYINEFIGEFDIPVSKPLYKLSQIAYKKVKG